MPTVVSTEGKSSSSLPGLESPSLGTKFIAPVLPTVVNGLPSRCKITALSLLKNAGGKPLALPHTFGTLAGPTAGLLTGSATLGSQMKHQLCTLAGDQSVANGGDDNGSKFQRGNVEALRKRIVDDTSHTTTKVLDFKTRYKNYVRPQLVSRCLMIPFPINDPWMVFLQRQTFQIFGHNPCYLSCFDIMAYEHGCKDGEWGMFLNHLLDKKGYVIEDWDSSYSTIETLMYYYGLRQPDDGTGEHFFKGECDASYDEVTNTASFSYIIWKDDQIVYSEVFSGLKCSSAVEAEIYAAYALLYKAEQLKIRKLLLWTDSRTAAAVLTGEHPISRDDDHRDFYLTLRAMRKRFSWLMVSWKPRELMFFADDLANLAKLPISESSAVKLALQKWSSHLRGLPVYRIERTKVTKTAVKKFSMFFEPYYMPDACNTSTSKSVKGSPPSKDLMVVLDYSVPRDVYYDSGTFHVVLVTPSERVSMTEKIPELTALGFVYFNDVRFPLNKAKEKEKAQEGQE